MKNNLLILLILFIVNAEAQEGYISKFPVRESKIQLTRIAQPSQYFDKVGRKAALMGFESGSFELWIWPWKLFRGFELQFFTGSSTTPVLSKDIVKEISVNPEATIITYSYESFTIREIIFIPVEQTAAVILLDINTNEPLSIIPGFIPVMQPQWPAGIGGQYSYWDDKVKAFVISESQRRGLFLCGSPAGKQMTSPPAHMFADNPLQFRIDVTKESASKGFIPIVIAGSPVKMSYDSVKILYNSIYSDIEKYYKENIRYYDELNENTLSIETPDKKLDLAFEWGKIGLHNLLVENKNLGRGLVAGYGLSGGGGRAGFSWYFGGDAYINSLAMNSFQDFKTVKDALLFTQKWQRQDNYPVRKKSADEKNNDIGKMAHELSQSDGLIDWWNDYHFGYNHADTSPWYLVAMGDYYRNSGDSSFIKDSWNSIKQAFRWCLSKDSNGDGLMDLKGAGLGVLEFGSLVNIHNDIYTQVLWTQGLKEVILMAHVTGDQEILTQAESLLKKALPALEKIYWMEEQGFYSFGANEKGDQVKEKSIYSSSSLFFGLMDEKRSVSTLKKFNTSEMMTGWGVRNLSNKSDLYNPSNYNYGTVWPFTSYMIGTAEFNYNFFLQGYSIICSTIENIFRYGLGTAPEVLSGDLNTKLAEAYHNQGFSYSGYILPVMKGLFGLKTDAVNNTLTLSPKFPPDWNEASLKNINLNNRKIFFTYKKNNDKIAMQILNIGENKIAMYLSPVLPPGTDIISVKLNGKEKEFRQNKSLYATQVFLEEDISGDTNIEISFIPVASVYMIPQKISPGAENKSLIINSQEFRDGKLHIFLEVFSEENYLLGVNHPEKISGVTGAELRNNYLFISAEKTDSNSFIKKEIILEMRR
jgi:glycogen debranching enzyme